MRREMRHIAVEGLGDGSIRLLQVVDDPNNPDPEIVITCDQVPLVTAWLFEAVSDARGIQDEEEEPRAVPVGLFANGPEIESKDIQVFNNSQGMIILKIDEETFIEIAPAMAKRLRDRLSSAITSALTDLLRPDSHV